MKNLKCSFELKYRCLKSLIDKKSMSKHILTCFTALIFANCFTINAFAEEVDFPYIYAESYVVMERESGRILASKNMDQKKYMASTTKIMTTLLALETFDDLDEVVKAPSKYVGIEGSSIYLAPDQEISIRDLLYGVMLRSGNDASMVVAHYGGGEDAEKFIEDMNNKAEEIGAENTNFTNPHGLHNENHYTTAYDLALIAKNALENEEFREICSAENYSNSEHNLYMINKNKVVYQYDGGNGIKIGYTKMAGRCLVASATRDGVEIIVVVLNDDNWFNDAYKMFDTAFENYKSFEVVEKGKGVFVEEAMSYATTETSFDCVLTEEEFNRLEYKIKNIPIHIESDSDFTVYGMYEVWLDDDMLWSGRLIA